MAKRPAIKFRPLVTVLSDLSYQFPKVILVRGDRELTARDWFGKIRGNARYSPKDDGSTDRFVSAEDAQGKLVILEWTEKGSIPFAAEKGSKHIP